MTDTDKALPAERGDTSQLLEMFRTAGIPMDFDPDPEAAGRRILERILAAETLDDIDAPWREDDTAALAGRFFRINGVSFTPYESENGPIPLARVKSVDLTTGEAKEWRTTASALVGQLVVITKQEAWGHDWQVVAADTRSKRKAYHLERVRS